MVLTKDYSASCRERLSQARAIADTLRHDPAKHRAAMNAVFVLEDCHEALARIQDELTRIQQRLMVRS